MGQRVLVTAGASGIGREIASAFAASGASVFVCDIDAKALTVIAAEVRGLKTGICDVSKRADIERMVAECARSGRSRRSRQQRRHCRPHGSRRGNGPRRVG